MAHNRTISARQRAERLPTAPRRSSRWCIGLECCWTQMQGAALRYRILVTGHKHWVLAVRCHGNQPCARPSVRSQQSRARSSVARGPPHSVRFDACWGYCMASPRELLLNGPPAKFTRTSVTVVRLLGIGPHYRSHDCSASLVSVQLKKRWRLNVFRVSSQETGPDVRSQVAKHASDCGGAPQTQGGYDHTPGRGAGQDV